MSIRDRMLAHMPDDEWIEINRLIILAQIWPSDARLEIDRMHDDGVIDARFYGGKIECKKVAA